MAKIMIGKYEGSIYPEDGNYTGALHLGFNSKGRRLRVKRKAKTKAQVKDKDKLREAVADLEAGITTDVKYTVEDAVSDFLAKGLKGRSKATEVLAAAAWLHDIGYAPGLAATGFHPLDGARHLSGLGAPERVVNLVARHSNAILEAELRGLGDQVAAFPDEAGPVRDALWYCDLTTSPDGDSVRAGDRIAEIKERYGPGHIVTQFITEGSPELLAAVERTERRLTRELAC
jgi:hypothetical protein